jgi:CheY-like chemotaxis protein
MMSAGTHILLVEDNSFDAKVFRRALRAAKLENPITVVGNGVDALTILRGDARPEDLIVVTDLNMPRVNGIDLLRTIRGDVSFAHLPVFVLTTSDAPSDRTEAFELGIEGYIHKTGEDTNLVEPIIDYLSRQERCKA